MLSRNALVNACTAPPSPPSFMQVNVEYDKINEGETIIRTAANSWVACRKSGHQRFFVVFTQKKAANFAEINCTSSMEIARARS